MELTHLKTFLTVARKGNLSAAARELHATQPNLGRQMTALSKEVGMELFIRHSRGVELTKQGQKFLELCLQIVGQLEQGTTRIREMESDPEGTLKFLTGTGSLMCILELLPSFTQKYPKLRISFPETVNILTVNVHELQIGDIDAVLVPFSFSDPDLVQCPLFEMSLRIYGAPQYLQSHGVPKTLHELQKHKVLVYTGHNKNIHNKPIIDPDTQGFYVPPFYTVNSGLSMRTALISSLGIGCYGYDQDLIETNRLVDIFPDMPDQKIPYYYTYHKRLEGSPKIQAFHEFLKDVVKVWQRPGKKS